MNNKVALSVVEEGQVSGAGDSTLADDYRDEEYLLLMILTAFLSKP